MKNIRSISIPQPCHESWQQMAPVDGGRHCQSCTRTVTDFTAMTNSEIINYLASHKNVCGRMKEEQIYSVDQGFQKPAKPISTLLNYRIAALFAAIVTFTKAEAGNHVKRLPVKIEQHIKPVLQDTIAGDVSSTTIRGRVYDERDGTRIKGATIQIKGANIITLTDAKGFFVLNAPRQYSTFIVRAIGYETQEIQLKINKKSKYRVHLKSNRFMMGEVVVVE